MLLKFKFFLLSNFPFLFQNFHVRNSKIFKILPRPVSQLAIDFLPFNFSVKVRSDHSQWVSWDEADEVPKGVQVRHAVAFVKITKNSIVDPNENCENLGGERKIVCLDFKELISTLSTSLSTMSIQFRLCRLDFDFVDSISTLSTRLRIYFNFVDSISNLSNQFRICRINFDFFDSISTLSTSLSTMSIQFRLCRLNFDFVDSISTCRINFDFVDSISTLSTSLLTHPNRHRPPSKSKNFRILFSHSFEFLCEDENCWNHN